MCILQDPNTKIRDIVYKFTSTALDLRLRRNHTDFLTICDIKLTKPNSNNILINNVVYIL